jgi:hypothetical protein
MTRLVVHAGTHGTRWLDCWRQLVSWRRPLAEAGVRLHPSDQAEAWLSDTHALAAGGNPPEALLVAAEAAVRDGADIVLLSSERLEDPLRDPAQLAGIESFAADIGVPLTVVVVLRDQLGYLNHLYCERVSQLHMAKDFASFVADPTPGARFDYGSAFRTLIDSPDTTLAAVRYTEMRAGAEAKAVLAAAGVSPPDLAGLPALQVSDALPGPVLVAAYRLLFKRLWRLGLISRLPRGQLAAVARRLADYAAEGHWDTSSFWGWDAGSRGAAITRFAAGNDVLAEQLWHRPWGDDWEDGEYVDIDLPARDPRQVVDVLTAVDAIVTDLQASSGPDAQD